MYSINKKINIICKALGYKTRTDILSEINSEKDLTLSKLSERFKMLPETLRFHLNELKKANLVLSKKKKKEVRLSINTKLLEETAEKIRQITSQTN